MLLILLVTACGSAAPTEQPSVVIKRPTSTPIPQEPTPEQPLAGPVEKAVIKQLAANLRLRESDISVVSYEAVEFSNACLDVVLEDVQCSQVVTPGRVVVLEAKGVQYKYHTSENGDHLQPANLALVWKREGGIAGFCDTLTVFLSGEVYARQCQGQAEGKMDTLAQLLTATEQKQFSQWIADFGQVELDASDPKGVSDQMMVTLNFWGNGKKQPAESERKALFEFAQNLYQKVAQ